MERLSKQTWSNYVERPEKVLQFGEGNFLRAFVGWQIDELNKKTDFNGQVVVVQPRGQGKMARINNQDGLFTLLLQGLKDGQPVEERTVINSISRGIELFEDFNSYLDLAHTPSLRFVISNTTEAGIVFDENDQLMDQPPKSFPAKLTVFLYERYVAFNGAQDKGLILLPCELIEKNGELLKSYVLNYASLWQLPEQFSNWIESANYFCNTLVDRIVPGVPKEFEQIQQELGYEDELIVAAEHYYFWAIQGPDIVKEELPVAEIGLNTIFVDDLAPYRTRKVRILNGAHTVMAPLAYLYGIRTVKEAMNHPVVGDFINQTIFNEIVPLIDGDKNEIEIFAQDVIERFRNPYIEHFLISITMNSVSKFKTRVVPTLIEFYQSTGKFPINIAFSLAALIVFYKGKQGNETINLADDPHVLDHFAAQWNLFDGSIGSSQKLVETILSNENLWGMKLSEVEGLITFVSESLYQIEQNGMQQALHNVFQVTK